MPTVLALALTAPTLAAPKVEGFGELRWGAALKEARKRLVGLRPVDDADAVRFERDALDAARDEDAFMARAAGPKAVRAFRKAKRPKPRLSAFGYWVKLDALPAHIELHFADRQLYGATVSILYRADQKPAAGVLLDLLVEKYGEPTPPAEGSAPPGERAVVRWEGAVGSVVLHKRVAEKGARGLLHLTYRSATLSEGVDRYLEGLRGRLVQVEKVRADRAAREAQDKRDARKANLLRHL